MRAWPALFNVIFCHCRPARAPALQLPTLSPPGDVLSIHSNVHLEASALLGRFPKRMGMDCMPTKRGYRRMQVFLWLYEGKSSEEVDVLSRFSLRQALRLITVFNHAGLDGLIPPQLYSAQETSCPRRTRWSAGIWPSWCSAIPPGTRSNGSTGITYSRSIRRRARPISMPSSVSG